MFGLDDVLSLGGSLLTGYLNKEAAAGRQSDAQEFSAQQYATRYQTTVKDMQAAGLNPALAYAGISGSSPTSSAASSAGTPDLGANYNQKRLTTAQVANIEADTANKDAQAKLLEAQANHYNASAGQAVANVSLIEANVTKVIEETKNIPDMGKQIRQTVQLLADQAALAAQKGETEVQIRSQIAATVRKLKSETKLLDFDIDAASDLGNIGRYGKEAKTVIDVIRSLTRK